MKDQFLELQILSQSLWNDVKAIKHNACNKKRTFANIEKTISKIKSLKLDKELQLLKELNLQKHEKTMYKPKPETNNTLPPPSIKKKYEEPRQISDDEWFYKGCIIQKQINHPKLSGCYEVFRNNKEQSDIGRAFTFEDAKKLCEENASTDEYYKF